MKKILIVSLFLGIYIIGFTQTEKYFISFKDKPVSIELLENPSLYLSQKAIARREKFGIDILENDLPVNTTYIDSLQKLGTKVWYNSRWFNGVYVEIDSTTLQKINTLNFITKIEAMEKELPGGIQRVLADYGDSQSQNSMLGIRQMHEDELTGKGINIALIDGGYRNSGSIDGFSKLSIVGTYDFVDKETNVYDDHQHGTQVLSAVGAFREGEIIGGAYEANYYLLRSENVFSEFRIEEYNWLLAAEYADSVGADIISTSLGYFDFDNANQNYTHDDLTGDQAVVSKAANIATSKGILVIASAGNEGSKNWKRITFPAEATSVLAVGAVDVDQEAASFTSVGMVENNRVKPNVSAFGKQTVLLNSSGNVMRDNGTSFSAPIVCGLVAGLMQAYPTIQPFEWIDYLERSASLYTNPDAQRGYGVPNYSTIKAILEEKVVDVIHEDEVLIYPTILINHSGNLTIESNLVGEKMDILVCDVLGRQFFSKKIKYQKYLSFPLEIDGVNTLLVRVIVKDRVFTQRIAIY